MHGSAFPDKTQPRDYLRFFGAWVRRPMQNGSVVPSSRHLARRMVAGIDPADGRVVELGGGTGVFTRAILATGLPPERLEVVEVNPILARSLRQTFADISIVECWAQQFSRHAAGEAGSYQAAVSGLPLLAMDRAIQRAILADIFTMLAPGAGMMQFTYATRSPVHADVLAGLGLKAERVGRTMRNFPPATLFRISRR